MSQWINEEAQSSQEQYVNTVEGEKLVWTHFHRWHVLSEVEVCSHKAYSRLQAKSLATISPVPH